MRACHRQDLRSREQENPGLFGHIESLQGQRPWGDVLDAGTGQHSARWISALETRSWTALTASEAMADQVSRAIEGRRRSVDRLLVGNWTDSELLAGEAFDTVLVDYLLGAIDGYAPYWQSQLFPRLRPLVRGRMYVTGVEPYVPFPATTEAGQIVREIGCLRDACLLLAGERPYREFPIEWVALEIERAGFRIIDAQHHSIIYRQRFVDSQLGMCRDRVKRFSSGAPDQAMLSYIDELHGRATALIDRDGGLRHGADYLIAAEPGD
jgi:hypothetical protein